MSKLFYRSVAASAALMTAATAFAQPPTSTGNAIGATLEWIITLANRVIALLFVVATLVFLWGVIQFIAKAGDEAARNKAKGIMTWGIVGLAVMAAAWGVTQILISSFGISNSPPTFVPPPVK